MIPFWWIVGISIYDLNDPASQIGNLKLSFSQNSVLLSNLLFYQLNAEDNAIITITNFKLECIIVQSDFHQCKSENGVCGMILENKRAILHQLYFGFISVHYNFHDAGTVMHVEGADLEIIDVSMKSVVHYDPPSQISLSFTKLNATLKDSNHSTGRMRSGIGYTSSWCLFEEATLTSSYCGYHNLDGGHCLNTYQGKSCLCNNIIFSNVTAPNNIAMININRSGFSFDECICIDSGPLYVSFDVMFSRWYFSGGSPPGPQFTDTVEDRPFELGIPIRRRYIRECSIWRRNEIRLISMFGALINIPQS